ncbi:MAG TPA: pyridoxal phosphate-dependent aminotransferase [Firmicutes bacterium]|nr:pyridoxal phosphate-dependent aminotransferase [Bacillota bacterium]
MMYDFDILINRYNTDSVKYDFALERGKPADVIPMWVADMDFAAPPEVLADIQKAVTHGIFGYTEVKDDYYQALSSWFSSRFGFHFNDKDVIKVPGVVFALAQAVVAFTQPSDSVIIQTPVYRPFYQVVETNGRKLVCNPLVYTNGTYAIDFADFERKVRTENVKLFILCSPHNPVGRVWERGELEELNRICVKYGVIIVSDEIHCDFVYPGYKHTCFGLINEDAVIATAPSKTFNLAGLQAANIVVKNTDLRNKLAATVANTGFGHLNTIAYAACRSAYAHGAAWLEQLIQYLAENIRLVRDFLATELPDVKLCEPQGTYLLWLDFAAYHLTQDELDRRMTEGARLWLNSGTIFGKEGHGFQRMNIACPKATLQTALERLGREFAR